MVYNSIVGQDLSNFIFLTYHQLEIKKSNKAMLTLVITSSLGLGTCSITDW